MHSGLVYMVQGRRGLGLVFCLLATGCGAYFAPPGLSRVQDARGSSTATCAPLTANHWRGATKARERRPHIGWASTRYLHTILPGRLQWHSALRSEAGSGDSGPKEEAQAALEKVAVPEVRFSNPSPCAARSLPHLYLGC